uniref:Copia protein n=1 Tax=Tanacetum cinerariifolium TaxID=118510 RepID=A0A6L2JFJ0_TANCI|nr:copia protein [Tanacetum cinerariifolium]
MGCCLTSWFSKKQTALSISTTKAEYVSVRKACQQALWMKQALVDYDIKLDDIPVLCDSKGAIGLSKNPVLHSRTKHRQIRHHFLRDNVQKGNISIEKVSSKDNIVDILTKPVKREPFNFLRLGIPTSSDEFSLPEQLSTANEDKFPLLIQSDATADELCAAAEVIEFKDSYEAPKDNVTIGLASDGTGKKKGRTVALTTNDMQKRKNDVKARTTLLLALLHEYQLRFSKHKTAQELWAAILKTFDGNEATKKTKKNLLKQQYGNFKAEGSETLEQIFNILQVIVSHLEFLDIEIKQDDLNQKFLTSLAPEWLMHIIMWRNRSDLDTISLDDLYNHLKVYESEVQKKLELNSQNMAFISLAKHSSGNDEVKTASVSTTSTNVSTASSNIRVASIRQDTAYAYIAFQSNGKKITIQGTDVAVFDKSKVECFNCHKMRQCRAPRSQDRGRKDNYKQGSKIKEQAPKALMAIDGVESRANCIESLTKELELIKKEKEVLDSKLIGFQTASKDLDNLLESQRLDMNKEGLGYSAVPPFMLKSVLLPRRICLRQTKASPSTILSKPFIKFVKAANPLTVAKSDKKETVRKPSVKYAKQYRKPTKQSNVRGNQRNWNNLKSQQLGNNFVMKKACYNCGGIDHLSYNCGKRVDHGSSWAKNNNTCKSMSPRPFIHRPYRPPIRHVRPNMNVAQPKRTYFHKPAHSYNKRLFQRTSAVRSQFRDPRIATVNRKFPTVNRKLPTVNRKFPTGNIKFSTVDMGNKRKAVKASACWFWKPSQNLSNKGPNSNSVSVMFKKYTYIDTQGRLNGCSRHMTGNISYLSDYEPFDEGYVSFGQGGCKITGKGTIKIGKLEFENVYFVKVLKYNLFSVSQICDNKNSVLFTNSVRIVLERDFKLIDDTNVLFRTPRKHNMYSIDLNNIVPHKDLTCLVAKAFEDECTKDAASKEVKKDVSSLRYIALPNWVHDALLESTSMETPIPTVSSPIPTACLNDSPEPSSDTRLISKRVANQVETPSLDNILTLTNRFEDILRVTTNSDKSNGVEADVSNMETTITASPTPTLRIHKDHPKSQIIGLVDTPIQTRHKSKGNVWSLVDCPKGVRPIRTKWVLKNKKDERGIVIKNKSRLVAQGHTQEEGIDYDEVVAPVARIEAIRLFLAYASFIDRKSTTRGCQFLGRRLILWQCKKQIIMATSTTEAEYVVAASCCGQVLWIQNQLLDYGDCFEKKLISVDHIHTDENVADLLTKSFDAGRLSMSCEALSKEISSSILLFLRLIPLGEGFGTSTEPHHTPSPEAQQTSPTTYSSPSLPPVSTESLPTVIPSDNPPLRQCTRRTKIAQSSDRANITKTSTLPSDLTPRVTSLVADEGSMRQKLDKLMALCISLQRQQSEMVSRFEARELEINSLKARIKLLEDKDKWVAAQSGDDAPIKGRSLKVATATVSIPTGSGVVSTASTTILSAALIFTTATESTPYTRRKGKEKMVESDTPKKKKLQEQIDISRDAKVARIHAEEELQMMINSLDRSNETVVNYLQEYEQIPKDLSIRERIELISDLVKYQENYAQVLKYQTLQRKPRSKKQEKDYYMAVIKGHSGWKTKDFKRMSFEQIEAKFNTVWKQIEDFIPMGSKEEAERLKRKGLRLEQESAKKLKTSEEAPKEVKSSEGVPEEKVKEMMQLVPVEEIIRLGGSSASYQFFMDMLKHFDREDLNQLWGLVKETLNIRPATSDKEKELWVELKRLFEPNVEDDLWTHTQNLMHAPLEWMLYDTCGVHHVLTKDQDIFMLVEKDYPLRKRLAIRMVSYKMQVENYSKMENDLIIKIYKIASSPRQQDD